MPSIPDLELLLPALFDGVLEEPIWATFLEKLRVATGAEYTSLFFRSPHRPLNSVVHLYAGNASPPQVSRFYHEHLYQRDPIPYFHLIEGHPYSIDELLRQGEVNDDAYYQRLLVPSGMAILRIMRVMEQGGVNVWLSVGRSSKEFEAYVPALMRKLAPYLRTALRNVVALEHAKFASHIAEEAFRRLDCCWFTLDSSGQVLDADKGAASLFANSRFLGLKPNGKLFASCRAVERDIMNGVQSLIAEDDGRPRAIVLNRDPWYDMVLMPTHHRTISSKPDPAVVAYVRGGSWSSASGCEMLAELFELNASEARLALALSRGMKIAEAATELGFTIETARNYSKKIYAKLGVRGQADVVRLIMRSVFAIAQKPCYEPAHVPTLGFPSASIVSAIPNSFYSDAKVHA